MPGKYRHHGWIKSYGWLPYVRRPSVLLCQRLLTGELCACGGSLLVNRDNIDALSKAIGMFSPEDVKRILEALARDNKIQQMKKELDDMENGDTEVKFQIGNQEFTLKEWDHFLEKFDSAQDAIRAALEEKLEKEEEERIEEEIQSNSAPNPDFYDIPEEIFRKLF